MYALTPKERLQKYARHRFKNYKEMELHCGLVNGAVGTSSEVSMKNLIKVLEACPELSPDWLILGVGPMLRSLDQQKRISVAKENKEYEEAQIVEEVAEPTQPYKGKVKDEMITIPSSVLYALKQQLENKDAQIATLLQIIDANK